MAYQHSIRLYSFNWESDEYFSVNLSVITRSSEAINTFAGLNGLLGTFPLFGTTSVVNGYVKIPDQNVTGYPLTIGKLGLDGIRVTCYYGWDSTEQTPKIYYLDLSADNSTVAIIDDVREI